MKCVSLLLTVLLCGCQTAPKKTAQQESTDQVISAVKAVNAAFNVEDTGVKYCPVDGKRYSSRLEYCPDHKDVKLIPVK